MMAADEDANRNIVQEISILKKLNGHPNVIQFLIANQVEKLKTAHGMTEYQIVTELCTGTYNCSQKHCKTWLNYFYFRRKFDRCINHVSRKSADSNCGVPNILANL
jgi:serine/threonine protein kinase